MKLVILIPAYNEEKNIAKTISRIPLKISKINQIQTLVVSDGSTDKTAEKARKAGAEVIEYHPNGGVGKAFRTGLEGALDLGADIMVNIDADGQFNPEDIPLMIEPILKDEADFVAADRFTDGKGNFAKPANMPGLKYWGNLQMVKIINFLSGQKFNDVSCGFRAYSQKAMLMLNLQGGFTYTQESFLDLAMKEMRIKSIPVEVKYGEGVRKSRVFKNVFDYAFRTLYIIIRTFRDYKPLRFFGVAGLVFFIPSFIGGLFMLYHYLATSSFSPYKAIGFMSIYSFTLALLLWVLGLIADMFDRMRTNQEKILYYEKKAYYESKKKA